MDVRPPINMIKPIEIWNLNIILWQHDKYSQRSCNMMEKFRTASEWTLWWNSFPKLVCGFFVFSPRGTWLMRLKPSRSSMTRQLCLSQREATRRTFRCEVQFRSTGPRIFPPWCQNPQYDVRPRLNAKYLSYLLHETLCFVVQWWNSLLINGMCHILDNVAEILIMVYIFEILFAA